MFSHSHLQNSWNHDFWRRNMKLRSRSLRIVFSSISASCLSIVRPKTDPFKSKRLWIVYSVQKRFPMMMKRTLQIQHQSVKIIALKRKKEKRKVCLLNCQGHHCCWASQLIERGFRMWISYDSYSIYLWW